MIIFSQDFFAALSSWNDRVLLRRQDPMVRAEIPAGSAGKENSLLQAGSQTREQKMWEMENGFLP